ncbi:MAG: HTH domain-containing protein [Spirochaetales bacterium]|nr:HTH domain-containing protein [Spirochaetales bacterium]
MLNKDETASSLAEKLSVSKRTAERALSSLQSRNYIERVGSRRDGFWLVVK